VEHYLIDCEFPCRGEKLKSHGDGTQRQNKVCTLLDTTAFVGCKGCEIVRVERNDRPFPANALTNLH